MDLQSGRFATQTQELPEPPFSPLKTTNIPRKPAAPIGSEFHHAPRSALARYNPWGDPQRNIVSSDNHGPRQKLGKTAPQIMQSSSSLHSDDGRQRLVKHQSIDDWILKRDNAEHLLPPHIPQWPPQRSASVEPPLLNLSLDFEPMETTKHEPPNAKAQVTAKTSIPNDTSSNDLSKTSTSSRTDDILRMLSESINKHPQNTHAPSPDPTSPKDHITELEERRDRLTQRRVAIRQEIWALEQALDPTGSTQTHLRRSDIKVLMEQKNSELAGIEKEIFDVGMMIHRAWRRRCKNGEEGSTHLWIHNVVARTSE